MLMNLQLLPTGSSFYEKLKSAAARDRKAKKRLSALDYTLRHFGIQGEGEADMAEALLRLDVLYQSRRKPSPADIKTKVFFEMHEFFVRQYNT